MSRSPREGPGQVRKFRWNLELMRVLGLLMTGRMELTSRMRIGLGHGCWQWKTEHMTMRYDDEGELMFRYSDGQVVGIRLNNWCGAQQSGDLGSSNEALDGILGFGQSNSSMISQLAASGTARKIFAHCLDTINGGGIFVIGHVVQPKVKTTPLVPDQ
ncbi:hypothetical protein BHE74_00016408 [Ensete ventricosum]|nr:hypothetical protein BHE74_00016408 [Ensete ventricosum]